MAISYIYPPTGEKVVKEPWRWVALYADGSFLDQFEVKDGKATFHRFSEIDIENIKALRLVHDSLPFIEVSIFPNTKPIHYYKNVSMQHEQTLADGSKRTWGEKIRWYCIGYELDGVKHICAVTDANNIIMTSDPDALIVKSKGAY